VSKLACNAQWRTRSSGPCDIVWLDNVVWVDDNVIWLENKEKEVKLMEWITPDFEEFETEAEVTAYADHW